MNKTFTKLAFSKHSNLYSSSGQLKYSSSLTMPKQQQLQNKDSYGVSTNSCLYCVTKTVHPRLGRGETYVCGYKPYRCEICNYSTTTKGNLAIHQQSDKHLNNLQEHEQTIFNTADTRSNHSESPDCNRHQQNNLHQNLTHLNSASKKSNSSCDLNILTAQTLSERRTISSSHQNMKLDQKTIEFLQNKTENEKVRDNININKAITNFLEIGLPNGEDRMHQPSCPSYSSSVTDSTSFCYDHPLKTFIPLTSSYDNLLCNLTETANHPLACQVCCTFTTDNLDVLIEHVERNRVPFDLDYVTNLITLHTNGFWFCKLCSYKSPLKANFQLHCKTEKHAQRLSFLVHVCEGGLWNQSRILSTLNICENKMLDISNNNNVQCSTTKGQNYITSSMNITTNLTTHNNNSSNVGNNSSNCNNVKNNFNLTSSIQLYCIACDLFTTSVHKFRLHCQTLSHIGAVKIFTHLVNRRNYLWNTLASLSLFYVDLLKSLIDENDNDEETDNAHTDSSLNSTNKLKHQTKFNKILLQLSSILTNLQVVYVCHKNYLPFISPLTNCSSPSSSSPSINLMSPDKSSQQCVTRFKSLTNALNHWHVSEHQRSIAKQQFLTDHENLPQYNQFNDSNYYSNEIFDIHWQLNDIEGNIEELPTMIIKILIPIINDSINKQSIHSNEYNTLINSNIINDIELINSKQDYNYNLKNSMKDNEENNYNNELIHDKMKMIDIPYEQDTMNKTDQQYRILVDSNEQIINKKFKLLSEYIGQSDRKLILSLHKTPTTSNAEDNHLPTISATGSNNIGDVIIPFSPTERNGEQVNETEAIRCHSQNNSSAIDQNCTEDLTNATKYKLQPCKKLNKTVISIKSHAGDWPTRPNSEPILKLTNHNSSEFEIDSNKINIYKAKTYQNLSDSTVNNQEYKNIMTANAFLSSNCTVEDNVSASRLFLPKELHISDEWRKSEQRLTASNTSNMSSPIHNFNICGTSVTPMELFAQMTAHYKQISENCNYAQSMELFLTNPSVITQLASMNVSKITETVSISTSTAQQPPSSSSSSSDFTLTPLTTISKPSDLSSKQIDKIDSPTNHKRMSTNDFFHEFNILPNLHSLLKQSFELIICENFSNIQNDKYCSEELLAFTLEVIVNDKVYYSNIYEKLNNHWFKLEYIHELQMKEGNLCTYCCSDNYNDNDNDEDDNVNNENGNDNNKKRKHQNQSHRFLLESSLELHRNLQHSKQISDSNNNPLTVILTNSTFNELVEKLNLLISNSTFSDLFHSSLENHCKLQPYIKSSSPNLLSIHLKHIQSDSFQSMPKSLLQTNEIELNTTNSSTSFIVEQNFSAKNLATDNNTTTTTKNDINNICDSNIPLSLSMITSDQANLLHKDSIINDPHETLTNNVYSDHSNLLLNYTTTNKNDPNENNNITGKDNKINSLLTEAYFNSIKDYHLNNHHENIKFYEQYKQQTNTSIYSLQKRSRTRLNETQLNILRSYFDINNSPSDEKINEICNKTGLQEKVVKHWFRNTLFKERQKNKDNPYNFSIPPSTSLNIEEYEKTGRIELNNNNSFKQNYKLLYLNNNNNNEQNDKDKMNNLNLETNSNDLIIMKDKMNNDLYSIDQSIENENINNGSLNSTMKRSCEMESLKIIDQMKWINQNKRQRLEKDIQDGSLNDERPTSIVSIEDSDIIYNYKRNLHPTMTTTTTTTPSTENTDGEVHSFVLADNSNNSHESPPSITSESSPSISETPLSPRLPMIPELDNPQGVLAALIHLGHHNHIQQQSKSESEQKLTNLWGFPYLSSTSSSSTIRGFLNGTEVYTDPNKLHCQLTALMNASLSRTMPHIQTSSDSNEAPLDLSAKTTQSINVNSTGDNNCQNSSSFILEQNAQIIDNEDNNDFPVNNQDQFLSVPSLIQTEHVSSVYRSTSTTSSTNGGRRNRTSITALQSRCMHSIYNYHKTPSVHECDRLGEMIGLSRRVVQVWFQNQRAKEKKMARVSSGQYNLSVNSSLLTEKLSPIDSSSCIDSNFCQICSISIQKSEITNNSVLTNQQATNACNQSTNFSSHASFVDHLFSAVHLKKLLRWCTMDTT